jgi:CheY-like chemotaxis protein
MRMPGVMEDQTNTPAIVLLVQDEAILRMFVSDALREEGGFRVIEAANADEALTLLEAAGDNVQALITDVEMPGSMDGFTFTRVVRKAWPHIGLVVVSGRMKPQRDEVPEGSVFLAKPFAIPDLMNAVQSVLDPEPPVPAESAPPVLPAGIKIHQPHTSIGSAGGLAQPLPEPEE